MGAHRVALLRGGRVGGVLVGWGRCSAAGWSRRRDGPPVGMKVVQTWSPWARVASRWTWTPSRRENASVSASQNAGNSAATCCTGQCPWHSCTPASGGARLPTGRAEAAKPSRVSAATSASARPAGVVAGGGERAAYRSRARRRGCGRSGDRRGLPACGRGSAAPRGERGRSRTRARWWPASDEHVGPGRSAAAAAPGAGSRSAIRPACSTGASRWRRTRPGVRPSCRRARRR